MNKRKLMLLIAGVFFAALLFTSASYAFWSWVSNTNKSIVFNTSSNVKNYVVYDAGEASFVGDLGLNSSIHSTISINKNTNDINLNATIHMNINSIGDNMKSTTALKWKVTNGDDTTFNDTPIASGDFMDTDNGDVLTLVPNIPISLLSNNTSTKYTIWVWLDGSDGSSSKLSNETLDTSIWTEINQSDGAEDVFNITRISNDNQIISATVVDSLYDITGYAITTETATDPSNWENTSWTPISGTNIYNLKYTATSANTYYIWFKDDHHNPIYKTVTVSALDSTAPSCTFSAFNPTTIKNNETSTTTLTCTDNGTGVVSKTLTTSDFTVTGNSATITNITKSGISNGYKYTITLKGNNNNGNTSISLKANTIKDSVGNFITTVVTSGNVTVQNSVTCTGGTYLAANETSCTTCPAGSYCPGGEYNISSSNQGITLCAEGKYSGAGASSCTNCGVGSYASGTGNTSCTACANGKTSTAGASASTSCTNCTNSANVSAWTTQTWSSSNNTVTNLCTINTCNTGYSKSNNTCVANELTFANQTLSSGTYGTAYTSGAFTTASNGTGTYTYAIKSGAPSGATISSANRTISFTNSTAAGTYNVVVTATDSNSGKTKDATMTIVINKATQPMTVTNATMNTGATLNVSTKASSNQGTISCAIKTNGTTTASTLSGCTLTAGAMSSSDDNDQTVVVTLTAAGNDNYASGSKDVTVTVQKHTRTLSWDSTTPAENTEIAYGDTSKSVKANIGSGSGTAGSVTYSSGTTTAMTVNSSNGAITIVNGNSKSSVITATMARTTTVKQASITRTLKTKKAAQPMTVTNATMNTGATLNVSTKASSNQGTISCAIKTNGTTTASTLSGCTLTAGAMSSSDDNDQTVVVTLTAAGNDNYASGSKDVTVTVQKHTRTLSFKSSVPSTIKYNATATADVDISGSGGTAGSVSYSSGTTSVITVTGTTLKAVAASGSSVITATMARTTTVKQATATKAISAAKADNPISVTATQTWDQNYSTNATTKTFTAPSNAQGAVTYSIVSQAVKSSGTAVNYFSISNNSSNVLSIAGSSPVGQYTVVVRATAAGNDNYNSGYKDITFTVTYRYQAVFYYNKNATNGSTTIDSKTLYCYTSSSCTVTIPTEVTGSVGTYNNEYNGLRNETGNMSPTVAKSATTVSVSNNITYYAIYQTAVTIYRPNATNTCTTQSFYRNQWFTSASAMSSTILSTSATGTSNTNPTMYSDFTFNSLTTNYNNGGTTYNTVAAAATTNTTTFYTKETKGITVNFYYYNGTAQASTTNSGTKTLYCTSNSAATLVEGTVSVPSAVSSSTGPNSATNQGLSTSTSNATTTTTINTSSSNYYSVYNGSLTASFSTDDSHVSGLGSTSLSCNSNYTTNGTTYSAAGCNIILPSFTTVTGYEADGWYNTSNTKVGNIAAVVSITSNSTLKAKAKAIQSTVSFNANSGSGGQSSTVTATYGSAMPSISTTAPTRTGYTFMGWYDNATYTSGTQYYTAAGASARTWNKTSNTTLYAGWKVNTYYLDLNGLLDGASSGNISGYGTADVYINGSLVSNDVTDYWNAAVPYGTTYQITDIKSTSGHSYNGVSSGSLSGTVTGNTAVVLSFSTNTYWNDVNIISPSGVQDYQSGYVQLSRDGVNWTGNLVNEDETTNNVPYGGKIYVKWVGPYYDYYELDYVTGADWDSATGSYVHTVTAANQVITLYTRSLSGVTTLIKKIGTGGLVNSTGGYRYEGASPSNYVTFNGETWRIIGIFDVKTSESGATEKRIKLIRNDSIVECSFGSSNIWSSSYIRTGFSRAETGTAYGTTSGGSGYSTSSTFKLDSTAQSQIDNAVWYIGDSKREVTASQAYINEQSATWIGKMGLMSASDYGFASSSCKDGSRVLASYHNCTSTNWLYKGISEWTIIPASGNTYDELAVILQDSSLGYVTGGWKYNPYHVRPVVYLKASVKISGGNGSSGSPYTFN